MKIRCNEIYTEDNCIDGVLEFENGKITNIYKYDGFENDMFDARGYRLIPGIIDIHTHGYKGCCAHAINAEELVQLCKVMTSAGVTSFLPTAGEHFKDEMLNLKLLAELIENQKEGAKILGIHMEGPFLNPNRKGAFSLDQLLPCSINKMDEYLNASKNHIKYVSMAPELDDNGELITYLKDKDILVAGGHTTASADEYRKGIDYGISASTHTGNGMQQMDRRDVGALGAALLSDIYCEIICDFHHISKDMLDIMFKIKNDYNKFIMISDSADISGFEPGPYNMNGQARYIDEGGLIHLEDGTICGSSHNILYGIKNLEKHMNINMNDVLKMSSLNAARFLKIDSEKGSLKIGKDADFVIIDNNYKVLQTYVEGKCEYIK